MAVPLHADPRQKAAGTDYAPIPPVNCASAPGSVAARHSGPSARWWPTVAGRYADSRGRTLLTRCAVVVVGVLVFVGLTEAVSVVGRGLVSSPPSTPAVADEPVVLRPVQARRDPVVDSGRGCPWRVMSHRRRSVGTAQRRARRMGGRVHRGAVGVDGVTAMTAMAGGARSFGRSRPGGRELSPLSAARHAPCRSRSTAPATIRPCNVRTVRVPTQGSIDSRSVEDGSAIRRRRECTTCGRRFTTFERVEEAALVVAKRSGHRVPFSAGKVVAGVTAACKGRPVTDVAIAALAGEVEELARSSSSPQHRGHRAGGPRSAPVVSTMSPTCASRASTRASTMPRTSHESCASRGRRCAGPDGNGARPALIAVS